MTQRCLSPALRCWGAAALLTAPLAAAAIELTGTAFSIVYRGPAVAAPSGYAAPPPPAYSPRGRAAPPAYDPRGGVMLLRLVDARSGQELTRAVFDAKLDGWLFMLPAAPPGVCLALRAANGALLPVRDADAVGDGRSFRNPPWEAEMARQGEMGELRRELGGLQAREDAAGQELQRLQAQGAGLPCTAPPADPDPPRPAGALAEADARSLAAGVCAAKWQQAFAGRPFDIGRLFVDAGLAAEWSARDAARPVADALEVLRITAPAGDLAVMADAAAKGRAYLEHADGVRLLGRWQAACRNEVPRAAGAETARWEAAVQAVRQRPQRAVQQCEAASQRLAQLQQQQGSAANYRVEMERRLAALVAAPAPAARAVAIDQQRCSP